MKMVDLILFMGQSNMAGRGDASLAPVVEEGRGYEYCAVSKPDRLVPVREPFGVFENNPDGVYEPGMKTGSMVSAFINACYEKTNVPVVGISCSKGGSSIEEWEKGTAYFEDAKKRFVSGLRYLAGQEVQVRSKSMAWCQGCTDADRGMEKEVYKEKTRAFFQNWISLGIERIFLIQIGNNRDDLNLYVPVQEAQKELAEEMEQVFLVSDSFRDMAAAGLMKDCYHYKQEGYNLVGGEAGKAAGDLLNGMGG
ncbi:hypothetical protein GPL15_06915 [Clostridium sp. MCC353]|uniref:sialate O-acetylesterase n=1 Tax=Clostridium sp. MCC353 TaxID=2592646 RepID=UPI001C00E53A|nr:sialate O-acetylesterase [Clostridium sp. MCC353]MBT9776231.1 hypothetical protein [Clostridium sp. MCC353]